MPEELKDFFISRTGTDRAWAEWIAWQVKSEGYSVDLQDWHFRPGENFILKMQDAASRTRHTLAVISPSYLAATYTAPEWAAALAEDPQGTKRRLIPVKIEAVELTGLLRAIAYIDLVGVDQDEARRRLLDGIKVGPVEPLVEPQFPGQVHPHPPTVASAPRFPGTLPPVWNIPFLRNPHFTGRDDLLDELHKKLVSGRAALTVLHGLGGIGKTQTAVEYAYRRLEALDLVWWLPATDRAALLIAYNALAPHLHVTVASGETPRQIAIKVQQALGQLQRWLLIFDDADPKSLEGLIPGQSGATLVTSRNPNWPRAERVEVGLWLRPTAVHFIIERTGETHQDAADALAQELGDLPLALDQAAGYIETTATPIASYLDLFLTRRQDLWQEEGPPPDYPGTIATTWTVAMDKLRESEPAALGLLAILAFLAPEGTPMALVRQGRDQLPAPLAEVVGDELRLNRLVAALCRYSLLSRTGDILVAHRLVLTVTRDRLAPEERMTWLGAAVRMTLAVLGLKPGTVLTFISDEESYIHLASAVAQHLVPPVPEPETAIRLLDQLAQALFVYSRYKDAALVLARALEIAQSQASHEAFKLQFKLKFVTQKAEDEELDYSWGASDVPGD